MRFNEATFRDEPNDQDQDQADFVEDDQVIDSLLHRSRKESMAVIDTVDSLIRDHLAGFAAAGTTKEFISHFKKFTSVIPLIDKFGLLMPQFNTLFEMVLNNNLGPDRSKSVISCLLPRGDIADDYIIRIIGSLSNKDKDIKVTKQLLRWSVTVFDIIETKERLKKLYNVLFHYLTYASLRPYTCHLLYFLTHRQHVTPYRIRILNELIESEKDNKELIGLLMVYQTYNLDIAVSVNVRLVNAFVFENPFPELKTSLINIRRFWKNQIDTTRDVHKSAFQLPTKKKAKLLKSKKGPTEGVLKELDVIDITRIASNIENLDMPEQLDIVLENRRLQHILVGNPNDVVIARLTYWLTQKLLDLMRWNDSKDVTKQELYNTLIKLVQFTRFTKCHLPVIELFITKYLKTWNGFEFEDEIFELITYLKPADFKDLYLNLLKPLYRLYIVSNVTWKAKLILCYTEMLKNWAFLDWNRHTQMKKEKIDMDHVTTLFGDLSFNVDYFSTIQKLVEHVDRLCVMGLLAEQDHPLVQHAGLSFFELVSTMSLQDDIPDIIIPAAAFVHRHFFSTNAMAVSRICGIVCRYKDAFEKNDLKSVNWMSKHTPEYLHHFNTYMMDICNSLWRNLGLTRQEQNQLAFSLTDKNIQDFNRICQDRGAMANTVLSITHSAALAGFSKRFMTELEQEEGSQVKHYKPITTTFLKQLEEEGGISIGFLEYRVEYLDYLNDIGFNGVYDLLYACMGSLIQLKRSSSSTANSLKRK